MVEGMKFVVDLYENTTTYRMLGAKLSPIALRPCAHLGIRSNAYFACVAATVTLTLYHPAGIVVTGRDDHYKNISARPKGRSNGPAPVVDSQLRVFKTTGLRVVDASIMPVIVNSNTNIPSIRIGEMASHFIRRYWTKTSKITTPIRIFSK